MLGEESNALHHLQKLIYDLVCESHIQETTATGGFTTCGTFETTATH
jgi:hypothetical protein